MTFLHSTRIPAHRVESGQDSRIENRNFSTRNEFLMKLDAGKAVLANRYRIVK
jgi:hypothetical protein